MFFFTRGDHYVGRFIDSGREFLRTKAGCVCVCVGGGGGGGELRGAGEMGER